MNSFKQYGLLLVTIMPLLTSCQSNPHNVNVALPKTVPETKTTIFAQAIVDMGTMSAIYSSAPLRIMANEITDNTGTSIANNAEIPRDITAMVKSTLNAFGGNIVFIPYDPNFMANTINTGYTDFSNKIIPDIVVDGGITEFDRGLETKSDSTDVGLDGSLKGNKLGLEFEDSNKGSLARVTLDFNLIDFQTFAGIPQMQAINTIKLHKAVKKDSIGFTILSSSFGAQGTVKKVQGRHAAVRLLVQLSMLQVVGKYQHIPYWRLLPGTVRDVNLLNRVVDDYYSLPGHLRTAKLQMFLALNGYPVNVTGIQDQSTLAAKQQIIAKYQLDSGSNDARIFITAYENVPFTRENKYKSRQLNQRFAEVAQSGSIKSVASTRFSQAVIAPPPANPPAANPPEANIVSSKAKAVKQSKKEEAFSGNIYLKTNKESYIIGDVMTASFSVDKAMYVRLSVISSDGSVATLFPNAFQNDNYCQPGVTYHVPPPNSTEFSLDIGEPRGVDKIRAIGSKTPISSGQVNYLASGALDKSKIRGNVITAGTDVSIQ